MCDEYAGYNIFSGKRLACWVHVRRKFFNIAADNANAKHVLKIINKLYKVEKRLSKENNKNNWSDEEFFKQRNLARNSNQRKLLNSWKKYYFNMVINILPVALWG